jgi:hypothetical protein
MATTKTELYNNGALVATKTSAPFNTFEWTPANGEVGSASLTVKRYEDGVLTATSAAVGGTVNAAASHETETTAYMNNLSIPNDSTVYYNGTSQQTTGAALWTAVDDFVKREKAASRWTKIKYFRPAIGTSAAMQSKNLKDIATFDGSFVGGWTFDGKGRKSNGTDGYMLTGFTPSVDWTSADNSGITIVTYGTSAQGYPMASAAGSKVFSIKENATLWEGYYPALTMVNGAAGKIGVKTFTRTDGTTRGYRNGALEISGTINSNGLSTAQIAEAAFWDGSTASNFYGAYIGCSAAHLGFTEAEAIGFQNSIATLETDLLRKNW